MGVASDYMLLLPHRRMATWFGRDSTHSKGTHTHALLKLIVTPSTRNLTQLSLTLMQSYIIVLDIINILLMIIVSNETSGRD